MGGLAVAVVALKMRTGSSWPLLFGQQEVKGSGGVLVVGLGVVVLGRSLAAVTLQRECPVWSRCLDVSSSSSSIIINLTCRR